MTEYRLLPETARTRFYPALDGLRTIAVGMVVLTHYLPQCLPMGWMGVQLFFVLSGFLITGILYDTKDEPGRYSVFYIRRMLRIFPLYYGFLGAVLLLALAGRAELPPIYRLWPIYMQNFFWLLDGGRHTDLLQAASGRPLAAIGHLWSLAVEEQFYLVWPIVVFTIRSRVQLMRVCWAVIAARLVLGVVWQTHLPQAMLDGGVIYRMLPTQSDGFAMGGLLALWLRGRRTERTAARAGRVAMVALACFAGLLAVLHHWPWMAGGGEVFDYRSGFMGTVGLPLTNAVGVTMVFAVTRQTWLSRVCAVGWMRSVGKVSYGIYVFHLSVYWVTAHAVVRWATQHGMARVAGWVELVVGGTATLLLAYGSFYWFERPFLLLKNRFTFVRGEREAERAAHPA